MQSVEENQTQTEAQPKATEATAVGQTLKGKLTFYLKNNVTYENHILLDSSHLEQFRESIATALEKPDGVFKLIGSNNNKDDFTLMKIQDMSMVQYNILSDKDETKQITESVLDIK